MLKTYQTAQLFDLLSCSAVFFSVFLIASSASAAKYYVATNGSDSNSGTSESSPFRSIQHALDLVQAGDTVYVRGGIYYEDFWITKSGAQGSPITLSGYPGERPVLDFQSSAINNTIRGLNLQNASDYKLPIGWIVIQGFEIVHGWNGISFSNLHDSVIRHNIIHDSVEAGILGNGYRVTIDGNIDYHNGYDSNGKTTGTSVGGRDIVYGMYLTGTYFTITNNIISSNTGYGIQMAAYTFGDFSGSYLDHFAGTEYSNAQNWFVANNVFAYNGKVGIEVWNGNGSASDDTFENNIFYENCQGYTETCGGGDQGIDFYHSNGGHVLRNNMGYSSAGLSLVGGAIGDVTFSGENPTLMTWSGEKDGVNPLFINPSNFDFHLQSNSPAIDAGTSQQAPSVDFDGNSRPAGNEYDIGAYEYGGSGSATPAPS
jgi:hypothetical protein